MARISLLAILVLNLAVAASGQITIYVSANNPAVGAGVTQPFNGGPVAITPGGPSLGASSTMVQRIPASYLISAGLGAGSQLLDVALAPTATGTLTATNFTAAIGQAPATWSSSALSGNIVAPTTIYDSSVSGSFSWAVTQNTWNDLNTGPIGHPWDGVSDLALFMSASGVSTSGGPSGTGIILIWNGAFRAEGTLDRNWATGYLAGTATNSDSLGLKLRLSFNAVPPQSQGTVTFIPSNVVPPGGSIVVSMYDPAAGGDLCIPYVSCTLGPSPLAGSFLPSPLVLDFCTDFYFNHPYRSAVFELTPPGFAFTTLSSSGYATGLIHNPPLIPPGFAIPIHVAFVTMNGSTITGVSQSATVIFP